MIVPVILITEAKATGTKCVSAQCERCGAPFEYQITRTAVAHAPSALSFHAQKRARVKLERMLNTEHELVPCPSCQWVNEEAIRQFRKTRHRNMTPLTVLFALVGLVAATFFYFGAINIFDHPPSLREPFFLGVIFATLLICGGRLLWQARLRARIDPNNHAPGVPPTVPAGTPPAVLRSSEGVPVASIPSTSPDVENSAWAIFRAGTLQLPSLCCKCLDPAATQFRWPIIGELRVDVPLCACCARSNMTVLWLNIISPAPVCFLIAWGIAQFVPILDTTAIYTVTGLAAFIFYVAYLGSVIPRIVPCRLQVSDPQRALWKISFKNQDYTALVIHALAEAERTPDVEL